MSTRSLSETFPSELCLSLFHHPDLSAQVNLALTCKRLYQISEDKSLTELQTHRLFICLVQRRPLVELAESVRVIKLPGKMSAPTKLEFLASTLPRLNGLTTLIFRGEYAFREEQMSLLIPALEQLPKLRVLDLSKNQINSARAKALSPLLSRLTELTALHLSECELKDEEAILLAPALFHLRKLETLDLSSNKISQAGIEALAKPLCLLSQLQSFDFSFNQESWSSQVEGALRPLFQALTQLPRLKKLGLNSY